ncbi:hypothetical protein WN943_026706 [Citrus x changshan-huyou]
MNKKKGSSLNPKYKSSLSLISLVSTPYHSISGGLHPLKWKLNSQNLLLLTVKPTNVDHVHGYGVLRHRMRHTRKQKLYMHAYPMLLLVHCQVGECRFTPTVRYWWPISSFRIFKVTLRKLESRNSAPSFQSSKLSGHGKMMRTRNEGQYRHFNSSKFPGQTLQDSSAYINTQRFHIKLSFGRERNS